VKRLLLVRPSKVFNLKKAFFQNFKDKERSAKEILQSKQIIIVNLKFHQTFNAKIYLR